MSEQTHTITITADELELIQKGLRIFGDAQFETNPLSDWQKTSALRCKLQEKTDSEEKAAWRSEIKAKMEKEFPARVRFDHLKDIQKEAV